MMSTAGDGEASASCDAVLLPLTGIGPGGEPIRVWWKAFRSTRGGEVDVKWEHRRFILDCSFKQTEHNPLWRIIGDNWGRWRNLQAQGGLDPDQHSGLSKTAILAHGDASDETLRHAEQEHWTSTAGLLCLLCFWPAVRRELAARARAHCLGRLFLGQTAPPTEELVSLCSWAVPDPARNCCEPDADGDGVCACLREVVGSAEAFDPANIAPQEYLFDMMVALAKKWACPAAKSWLRSLLTETAAIVDSGFGEWGLQDWRKSDIAHLNGMTKRRRIDFHVKQFALKDSLTSGQQSTAADAVRSLASVHASTGCRWVNAEMAAFRASCMLSYKESMTVGLTLDATRLGRPAKEVLCGYLTNGPKQLHAPLPPQAGYVQKCWGRRAWPRAALSQLRCLSKRFSQRGAGYPQPETLNPKPENTKTPNPKTLKPYRVKVLGFRV